MPDRGTAAQSSPEPKQRADSSSAVIGGRIPDPWADEQPAARKVEPRSTTVGASAASTAAASTYADAAAQAHAAARAEQADEALSRARARIGADAAGREEAARAVPVALPRPPRELRPQAPRTGLRIGPLHAGQVVVWQIAIAAVAFVHRRPLPLLIPVAAVAAIALILTLVRFRGRWLYEWLGLGVRYATRRRSTPAGADDEKLLRTLTRGGRIETIEIDEREIAVISDATGFTVALEIVAPLDHNLVTRTLDLPALSELLPGPESTDPPVSLQVVVQTIPAPGVREDNEAVAASYRQLTYGAVPAQRRTWICLQALQTPDGDPPASMMIALINVIRRVERKLSKAGASVTVLRRADAVAELLALLNPLAIAGDEAAELRERWSSWRGGEAMHVCYRVLNWPNLADRAGASLIHLLSELPAATVTVAVAVRREGELNQVEAVVRSVVRDAQHADRAERELQQAARSVDAELQRLDGQQAFGVAASVPIGGFAI